MPLTSNGSMPVTETQKRLATAIVQTVAYVDVFDYPLLPAEIHRYLIGVNAPLAAVTELLAEGRLVPERLAQRDGYVTLPGRQAIVETRRRREGHARRLWPLAIRYGRLLAVLPFVRMVAVTGSLAVNNVEPEADIDYLIVTANDRLWLCRALIILIVRLAARWEVPLCPNYLLSERALSFPEPSLYAARELAQMVPLSGRHTYYRIRHVNRWADAWLPNATEPPRPPAELAAEPASGRQRLQTFLERRLEGRVGRRLEAWEMDRKLNRFNRQARAARIDSETVEVHFSADWCKGHFDGHARQIMQAYRQRIYSLGIGQ